MCSACGTRIHTLLISGVDPVSSTRSSSPTRVFATRKTGSMHSNRRRRPGGGSRRIRPRFARSVAIRFRASRRDSGLVLRRHARSPLARQSRASALMLDRMRDLMRRPLDTKIGQLVPAPSRMQRTWQGCLIWASDGQKDLSYHRTLCPLRTRITRVRLRRPGDLVRRNTSSRIAAIEISRSWRMWSSCERMPQAGDTICIIPDKALTSARRWEREGACSPPSGTGCSRCCTVRGVSETSGRVLPFAVNISCTTVAFDGRRPARHMDRICRTGRVSRHAPADPQLGARERRAASSLLAPSGKSDAVWP